jgi:tetratricopeptide (TPR) repeat protein
MTQTIGMADSSLTDPRWARIQVLFDLAADWPSNERRLRLEAAEADVTLRDEVLSLLHASDQEMLAAERLAVKPVQAAVRDLPKRIGPYSVLGLAGAGGRGRVFKAAQTVAGVQRVVAVKVMLDHLLSPEDLERFEREQRVLIDLDHPGIARFIGAGCDDEAGPYLAMEWVDGESILDYCQKRELSIASRVRLMIGVLEALQAAHRRLIVHLDLKPSNILVDSAGRVKVLDFGTAKLIAAEAPTSTLQLTPRYASPEQLRAEPVSTACDIYTAGLVLYEVVTGAWPYPHSESVVALCERATGRAEAVVQTGNADLDAVVQKTLELDSQRRYSSAEAFASDLAAWLEQRVVSARRPTVLYRLGRFVRRNRFAIAASAVALVLLAGMGVYAALQQVARQREADRSREMARFLNWMVTASATAASGRPAMTVAEMVERGDRRLNEAAELDDQQIATLKGSFAYLMREHGKEDAAERIAREAVIRADQSGDTNTRIGNRNTLAEILIRKSQCPEAVRFAREADSLVRGRESQLPAQLRVSYLSSRAAVSEACEGQLAVAIGYVEEALKLAAVVKAESFGLQPALLGASLRLQYALLLARAGRGAEAVASAETGGALAGTHPDGRYLQVALLRVRSQALAAKGDAAAALAAQRDAVRLAPGVVNPFEEIRMQTLLAGRTVDAGDGTEAVRLARGAVQAAMRRQAEIGPSFWMILADAAEVLARTHECREALQLYEDVNRLTQGRLPRTWQGNQWFYRAECASLSGHNAEAARLAQLAAETYGELLPPASKRRIRLETLAGQKP